jgi:hypothetical protein
MPSISAVLPLALQSRVDESANLERGNLSESTKASVIKCTSGGKDQTFNNTEEGKGITFVRWQVASLSSFGSASRDKAAIPSIVKDSKEVLRPATDSASCLLEIKRQAPRR